MKTIALSAIPVDALRPLDFEEISQEAISSLALSDKPLKLNPLRSSNRSVSPQGAMPGVNLAMSTTPAAISPAVQMPTGLGAKRPHEQNTLTPGETTGETSAKRTHF